MAWWLKVFAALTENPSLIPTEYKSSSIQAGETVQPLQCLLYKHEALTLICRTCVKRQMRQCTSVTQNWEVETRSFLRFTGQPF